MSVLLTIGSFATVLIALWLFSGLLLAAIYPCLRGILLRWHPATGSTILLLVLAFPVMLSLSTTILLFTPDAEGALVSFHCHADCGTHLPLLESPYVSGGGLVLLGGLLVLLAKRLVDNLRLSRTLLTQLVPLAIPEGPWEVLPQPQPLVFTLGWWRSRIFLTRGLQGQCRENELDIILEHEREHARRRDNVRLLLARLFMLPLPAKAEAKLFEDLHLLSESACDFAAARRHDNLEVAETLLRMQRLMPQQFELSRHTLATAFTGAEVGTRIRLLVSGRTMSPYEFLGPLTGIVLLLILSIALVDPLHHNVERLLGAKETAEPQIHL